MWLRVTILAFNILKTREMQRKRLRHSDGVLGSTIWEVTVRASFDVCLRRDIGGGGELPRGSQREGGGRGLLQMRFKALKEWTDGVGLGKSQPEVEGPGDERVAGRRPGPPLLNEPQRDHDLLGQSCSLPSSHRVQGDPTPRPHFPTSTSKVWAPPSPSTVFSLSWLYCCRSNWHPGRVYLTPAHQSSIMALCDLKITKCFSQLFSPWDSTLPMVQGAGHP